MPPRIPQPSDFAHLTSTKPPVLALSLHPPSPPESTTTFHILLHGLGDSEAPFARFATAVNLPGVYSIAVRGVSPVPESLVGSDFSSPSSSSSPQDVVGSWHWGDDLRLSSLSGDADIDPDPGFERSTELLLGRLVRETLVSRLGWDPADILLFGFGQGGSVALGLALRLAAGWAPRVEDVTEDATTTTSTSSTAPRSATAADDDRNRMFKGVVSIGGPLPDSMVSRPQQRSRTPVLLCHGQDSTALDEDAVASVRERFVDVRETVWPAGANRRRGDDSMPRNRDEMLPIMRFWAETLAALGPDGQGRSVF